MLINKTVDLIDSIDLFRNYVVVRIYLSLLDLLIKLFLIYISSCIYNNTVGLL